jgi:hypothetical protein
MRAAPEAVMVCTANIRLIEITPVKFWPGLRTDVVVDAVRGFRVTVVVVDDPLC